MVADSCSCSGSSRRGTGAWQAPMAIALSQLAIMRVLRVLLLCLAGLGFASGYPSGTLLLSEGGNDLNVNNASLLVVSPGWTPSWHMGNAFH